MFGGVFDSATIESKIKVLENQSGEPNFWDDAKKAEKVLGEIKYLKNRIEPWKELIVKIEDIEATYELAFESGDEELTEEVETLYNEAKAKFEKQSLLNLLPLMALITINLGIFNLLPLPALDGGRLLFIIIEMLFRKPVPAKYEGIVHAVGLIILLAFMLLVTAKDIWSLVVN